MAKILVIDDDRFMTLTLEKYLRSAGYDVLIATNGHGGLELARREKPDLILLDLMMPVMAGEDFLQHLRSDPDNRKTPVVVLTALTEKRKVLDALRYGASGYIAKPFNPNALLAKIKSLLVEQDEVSSVQPSDQVEGSVQEEGQT